MTSENVREEKRVILQNLYDQTISLMAHTTTEEQATRVCFVMIQNCIVFDDAIDRGYLTKEESEYYMKSMDSFFDENVAPILGLA